MEKLIGGLKLGISFVMIAGVAMSVALYMKGESTDGMIVSAIGVLLAVGIAGFMLYYLYKTALWNLKEMEYKWNLPILLGMSFFFLGVCYFIYLPFSAGAPEFVSSSLIFAILAFFIVVKDLTLLLRKRK